MNKHLRNYLNSFKTNKLFWKIFGIDFFFISVITLFFVWFGNYVATKSIEVMQGKSVEQIQNMLTVTNPEVMLEFLLPVKNFLVISLVVFIISIIITFMLYSFTRHLVWSNLTKKKSNHWKWNLLNLVIILPILAISFILLLLKLVFTLIFSFIQNISEIAWLIMTNLFSFLLILTIPLFVFLTYYSYSHHHKIWSSIGETTHLIKKYFYRLWPMLLFIIVTALLFTLITTLLKSWAPFWLGNIITLVGSIIFINWTRYYLLRTISAVK